MGYIFFSIQKHQKAQVQLWIAKASDLNVRDNSGLGSTPLLAALKCKSYEIAILLILAGADVNLANNRGYTALHYTARDDHAELTKLLIESGANLDAKSTDRYDVTPFGMIVSSICKSHHSMFLLASAGCRIEGICGTMPIAKKLARDALIQREEIFSMLTHQDFPDTVVQDIVDFMHHQKNIELLSRIP